MLYNLQALRALAAVLVVLHHNIGGPLIFGHYGVDLFFAISGFIMVYVIDTEAGVADFYTKRIIRVVPLYWVLTLLLFAVGALRPGLLESSSGDLTELFKSLFFLPYYAEEKEMYHPIVFVGWTLNYEMFFYLIFGGFIVLRDRVRVVAATSAVMVALVVIGSVFEGGRVFQFYTAPILLEFVAGMVLALFWQRLRMNGWAALAVMAAGVALFAVLDPYREFIDRGYLVGPVSLAMVAAAMAAENAGHVVRNQFILLLGAASYSLYLTHTYVLGLLDRIPLPGAQYLWIIMVPAVAIASYYVVEKPANRYLRKLIGKARLKSLRVA
jgi:exopolysaccharide production protein ExoZ